MKIESRMVALLRGAPIDTLFFTRALDEANEGELRAALKALDRRPAGKARRSAIERQLQTLEAQTAQ